MVEAASSSLLDAAIARVSGAEGDAPEDDFDWTFVSVDGLSVREAWALATTPWSPWLQGHVNVCPDVSDAEMAIRPRYEWVSVPLECDGESGDTMAAAVRGASLVWRAVAACRGYGIREHPRFWRRLLGKFERPELSPPDETARDDPVFTCRTWHGYHEKPMSDTSGLFETVAFPRFKLNVRCDVNTGVVDRRVRIFCGLEGIESYEEVVGPLEESLARLAPLVVASRLAGPVELLLSVGEKTFSETQLNELIAAIHGAATPPHVSLSRNLMMPLSYKVVAVHHNSYFWDYRDDDDNLVSSIFRDYRQLTTPMESRGLYSSSLVNTATAREFVLWALSSSGNNGGGYRHFCYFQHDDTRFYEGVPAICSALPHARCTHTFTLDWNEFDNDIRLGRHIAWLGYALFHPNTASSTWRKLDIRHQYELCGSSTMPDVRLLTLMAQGNNLGAALGIFDDVVDSYYLGTIRCGAKIMKRKEKTIKPYPPDHEASPPSIDSDLVQLREIRGDDSDEDYGSEEEVSDDDAFVDDDEYYYEEDEDREVKVEVDHESVLMTLEETTKMDVCVTTTDVTKLGEWVCVVVPGYGTGWVRSEFVERIESRPPGRPCLRALKVRNESPWSYPMDELLELLRLVRESLESFDLILTAYDDDEFVSAVLKLDRLQMLKSLRLKLGSASLLSKLVLPQKLQELKLRFQGCGVIPAQRFVQSPLIFALDLQYLHIITCTYPSDDTIRDFVHPMLRSLPHLQCFQWKALDYRTDVEDRVGKPLNYALRRFFSRTLLLPSELVVNGNDYAKARNVSATDLMVMLLSVGAHYTKDGTTGSVLGHLHRDVLLLITSFARNVDPPEVWIK